MRGTSQVPALHAASPSAVSCDRFPAGRLGRQRHEVLFGMGDTVSMHSQACRSGRRTTSAAQP